MLSLFDIIQAACGPPQGEDDEANATWEFAYPWQNPVLIALTIVGVFVGLFLYSQLAWGIVTFVLFLFGSGYATARFLFNVEERLRALRLAPLLGSIWCLFFWLLFTLMEFLK